MLPAIGHPYDWRAMKLNWRIASADVRFNAGTNGAYRPAGTTPALIASTRATIKTSPRGLGCQRSQRLHHFNSNLTMYARLLGVAALLIASLAYLLAGREAVPRAPYIQGRNGTVLFIGNKEDGLVNAQVATAAALLEGFPDIEVHFASFPGLSKKLERVAALAGRPMIIHELQGLDFSEAVTKRGKNLANIPHAPASAGIAHLTKDMQTWICPWSAEDYLALFREIGALIDEVEPAVVVLDTFLHPGVDAVRQKHWMHAFVTPNTLVDNFLGVQPRGGMFWKYPAVSSGFSFPVPLRSIPENIYLNMRFIYSVLWMPDLAVVRKELKASGITNPSKFYDLHLDDTPWITQTTEGASIPVDYVPPNVTSVGPISLNSAPAAEQDAELAAWLKGAPTVLVNLGSTVKYNEQQAGVMALAIAEVLEKTGAQVLWKFRKFGDYGDEPLKWLEKYVASGRLRMPAWLAADPLALLETGDVVLSVHHGGAGCYHETIS
ncbi:hypothetical protein F5X68DRAFT_199521 [Plectosphaerella plurivora]|uniref:Uncharacterized protein n=1 Tax=Plectosphaerella plurivora TaxID=936078 RepID=A0A9P8VHQ0_9PEZI|nr:hypothetical protein F5X68DRAFT_199521 [Plectosphaerella plurivora]